MYIVTGATLGTIQNNVLNEIYNKYGLEFKFDKFNNFMLFGVYCIQVGHSTIAHLEKVRGMTSFGAYVNEASLAHEEVFDEIRSRCRDRKSTRLNSSHVAISYAVFCLKK